MEYDLSLVYNQTKRYGLIEVAGDISTMMREVKFVDHHKTN